MSWLDTIRAIRRRGAKPAGVTLMLVRSRIPCVDGISAGGILAAQVLPHEDIGALDLRPLVGLYVTVEDHAGDADRHRRLGAAVAAIRTETLVMPCWQGDTCTLHIRRGDKTETHLL